MVYKCNEIETTAIIIIFIWVNGFHLKQYENLFAKLGYWSDKFQEII